MRVYIAAPWPRKSEAAAVGKLFEAAGHIVTSRWFDHEGDVNDSTGSSSPVDHIIEQAVQDIHDVQISQYLVVLNLEKSEGKAVETGIALACQIPVISVGPRSNIFQTLGYEVATVEEAITLIDVATLGLHEHVAYQNVDCGGCS